MSLIEEFISHNCIACGGNWAAMLMTGIERRWPSLYESLEDRPYNFFELSDIVCEQLYQEAALKYAEEYGILNYIVEGDTMIYTDRYPKGFEGVPRVRYYERRVDLNFPATVSQEINWRRAKRKTVNRH